MSNNSAYVKPCIYRYCNGKKYLDTADGLKAGAFEQDPSLHHKWSKVALSITDFSTQGKTAYGTFNLEPDDIPVLMETWRTLQTLKMFNPSAATFAKTWMKVIPKQEQAASLNSLTIQRIPVGNDGAERKQPWYIKVENGTCQAKTTSTGGTQAVSGTQKISASVFITLTDEDMLKMLSKTQSYIASWEAYAQWTLQQEVANRKAAAQQNSLQQDGYQQYGAYQNGCSA